MLLAGVAVDIGCFTRPSFPLSVERAEFDDRFSLFSELEKLSLPPWSFSAEIGLREAFGHHDVLCRAVFAFRKLLLTPRLFTSGVHFADRRQTLSRLEELADAGVQQIILRVDEDEARALSPACVNHLADGCHTNGIDLRLQFELLDTFSEDCCRIARLVEDRQFTVTVLPVRVRPTRLLALAHSPLLPPEERLQLVLNSTGSVILRRRTQHEVMDLLAGNASGARIKDLIAAARARL
jgi:hypothetical protein